MSELFTVTTSFPTIIFTVMLGVVLCYWAMVIIGAVGLDVFDVDVDFGVDGAAEGAVEGAAEGLAEGAAEGLAEGAAEGLAEGAAEGVVESAGEGALHSLGLVAGLFNVFRVRNIPFTVTMSILVLMSWTVSSIATVSLLPRLGFLPPTISEMLVGVGSLVVCMPVTTTLLRPLGRRLEPARLEKPIDRVGKMVKVTSSSVSRDFGEGTYDNNGPDIIMRLRCETENKLARGQFAMIVAYDAERDAYEVTPVDDMLSPANIRPKA